MDSIKVVLQQSLTYGATKAENEGAFPSYMDPL